MKSPARLPIFGVFFFVFAVTSGCFQTGRFADVRADGVFSETLTVEGPLDLEVYSGAGNITISGTESDRVEIVGNVRAWANSYDSAEDIVREIEDDPPIDQTGDRIVVGRVDNDRRFTRVSISYDVRVPENTAVRAQTGSGGAEIRSLVGDVDVRAGSGHLSIVDIEGAVRAQTGSGGIDAEFIAGPFSGRTGSGGVSLTQTVAAEVDVNTGSGGIRLWGVSGPLTARAGSGGIRVDGDPADAWRLTTGSGGVTLTLPPDASFNLDANTSSGRVNVDSPLDLDGDSDRRRQRLRGSVGAGGPSVDVRTGSGSIRIGT